MPSGLGKDVSHSVGVRNLAGGGHAHISPARDADGAFGGALQVRRDLCGEAAGIARAPDLLGAMTHNSASIRDATERQVGVAVRQDHMHPSLEEPSHQQWVNQLAPLLEAAQDRMEGCLENLVQWRWRDVVVAVDEFERWDHLSQLPSFSKMLMWCW